MSQRLGEVYKLLKKNQKKIEFTNTHSKITYDIFDTIKNQNKLYYPDLNQSFEIYADASDSGIGSVLLQNKKPVAIFSKQLNDARRNTLSQKKKHLPL